MFKLMLIIICTVLVSWYLLPFMAGSITIDDIIKEINMRGQTSTDPVPRHDWGGQYTCQKFDCNI